jgi:hypothetical protein
MPGTLVVFFVLSSSQRYGSGGHGIKSWFQVASKRVLKNEWLLHHIQINEDDARKTIQDA